MYLRVGQGVDDRGVEFGYHRLRRPLGRLNSAPTPNVKSGQCRLVHGRYIGRNSGAAWRGHSVGFDVSRAYKRQAIGRVGQRPVDILDGFGAAIVYAKAGAGEALQ